MYYNYPEEFTFPVLQEKALDICEIGYRNEEVILKNNIFEVIDEEYAELSSLRSEE